MRSCFIVALKFPADEDAEEGRRSTGFSTNAWLSHHLQKRCFTLITFVDTLMPEKSWQISCKHLCGKDNDVSSRTVFSVYKDTTERLAWPGQNSLSQVFKYYAVKLLTSTFQVNLGQTIKEDALCIKKHGTCHFGPSLFFHFIFLSF